MAPSPANALPLLFDADEKAYRISLKPCVPGLPSVAIPAGTATASAVPSSTSAGGTRTTTEAIFISNDSTFLPRYSGVRPTMSPAMKTARIANTSMP
jgi:hypothetical protein